MYKPSPYIGFIVHGHPARRRRFEKTLTKHREALSKISYRVMYTKPGMASTDARNLADEQCTHIIGVGGDGTISDVIHGIMSSDNKEVIAGLLPQGTANDWSKTWPSAASFARLLEIIQSGEWHLADVGYVEFANKESRYFINIADLGIGAEVVRKVNRSRKWLGANMTFFLSILRTFLTYRNVEVKCSADNWEWHGRANSVIAANGRYFGSGIGIAPEASPTDGVLDVVILGDVSLGDYLRYLPALKRAEKIDDPRVLYRQTRSLTISTPDVSGVEADGELFGNGSVTISLIPGRIRLIPPLK